MRRLLNFSLFNSISFILLSLNTQAQWRQVYDWKRDQAFSPSSSSYVYKKVDSPLPPSNNDASSSYPHSYSSSNYNAFQDENVQHHSLYSNTYVSDNDYSPKVEDSPFVTTHYGSSSEDNGFISSNVSSDSFQSSSGSFTSKDPYESGLFSDPSTSFASSEQTYSNPSQYEDSISSNIEFHSPAHQSNGFSDNFEGYSTFSKEESSSVSDYSSSNGDGEGEYYSPGKYSYSIGDLPSSSDQFYSNANGDYSHYYDSSKNKDFSKETFYDNENLYSSHQDEKPFTSDNSEYSQTSDFWAEDNEDSSYISGSAISPAVSETYSYFPESHLKDGEISDEDNSPSDSFKSFDSSDDKNNDHSEDVLLSSAPNSYSSSDINVPSSFTSIGIQKTTPIPSKHIDNYTENSPITPDPVLSGFDIDIEPELTSEENETKQTHQENIFDVSLSNQEKNKTNDFINSTPYLTVFGSVDGDKYVDPLTGTIIINDFGKYALKSEDILSFNKSDSLESSTEVPIIFSSTTTMSLEVTNSKPIIFPTPKPFNSTPSNDVKKVETDKKPKTCLKKDQKCVRWTSCQASKGKFAGMCGASGFEVCCHVPVFDASSSHSPKETPKFAHKKKTQFSIQKKEPESPKKSIKKSPTTSKPFSTIKQFDSKPISTVEQSTSRPLLKIEQSKPSTTLKQTTSRPINFSLISKNSHLRSIRCPAATICIPKNRCTLYGFSSDKIVDISEAKRKYQGVPLLKCNLKKALLDEKSSGLDEEKVCCRDSSYSGDWKR